VGEAGGGGAAKAVPPRLGLGCWEFGGLGEAGPRGAQAASIIRRAIGIGVGHLDTAESYGEGESERIVGEALRSEAGSAGPAGSAGKAAPQPGLFVATKAMLRDTAAEAVAAVEGSLRRLGLDRIDLYYIHWPRKGVDPGPMMEGLEACRSRGLVGAVGVSNFSVADMEAASRSGRIDYHQLCWNALWRKAEREVVPYCAERGIGVVAYSPLAQGLLSGARARGARRAGDPRDGNIFHDPEVKERLSPIIERMRALAADSGLELSELALRWASSRPGLASVVAGASTIPQLEENARAADSGPLGGELAAEFDRLSREADAVVPDAGNIFRYYP
jgi:aryl-alcohol dehydrogenase-like predicted oxidoreductase